MREDQGLQPASIEGLSVELLQMVLSELPDVSSLRAAALSCPLLYGVFLEADTTITTRVLLNQIDDSVLPEAELAFLSSSLHHGPEPKYRHVVVDFITQNLRQRPTPPSSWSLQKALQLERLHLCVSELTQKFVHTTLTTYPMTQSKCTATRLERCRIERAFYRFELYCNLFRMLPEIGAELPIRVEQNKLFFACFAPWENEQLGCIHDFLVRAVSPAFNDIAEHDIAWGAFRVEYDDRIDSPFIQHILSRGLKKLYSIILAETYLERHQLLYDRGFPSITDNFLYEGLQSANEHNDHVSLDGWSPENEALLTRRSFVADPDSGPRDAWQWAHREEAWTNWVYQEDRDNIRRWGYVMWDRCRLDSVGILQVPWEDTRSSTELQLEEQEAARQRAYMENSWEKREKMYRRGAVGWWSWGDESQVLWPDGVAPGQRPSVPVHVKPDSIEEARDVLRMMKLPPSCAK
ncbi:hypothetical protein H634G_04226 [Metarhizium anisopliae BRIP 53293]|uniref:F-box domain-containing protein n=1 Tax=Metarhizium anisopliae BRIP 53293 TaxID=1291518 RepID=A0A0D9P111_METAN|nr:hypothetical protein H634G_04226 [Metarhizium anisopliae BRIP 53293]KJK91682.1 hypothetical protein H633G_04427 [Metarhizium anisopliae BRIP 53284]